MVCVDVVVLLCVYGVASGVGIVLVIVEVLVYRVVATNLT